MNAVCRLAGPVAPMDSRGAREGRSNWRVVGPTAFMKFFAQATVSVMGTLGVTVGHGSRGSTAMQDAWLSTGMADARGNRRFRNARSGPIGYTEMPWRDLCGPGSLGSAAEP